MDAITRTLSAYAVELSHADLTEQAVHGMRQRLVDSAACALGAYDSEPALIARDLARSSPGEPPARVLLSGDAASPEMAAFANTVMVRYLDFNDTYFAAAGGHPSDTVGGVLAGAGAWGLSGRDAILAMVTAYEIFCVLGEVEARVGQPTRAAIATAAATGKMLGLDLEGVAHAVSLALTTNPAPAGGAAGALGEGRQSMWKAGAPANAARGGVFAARLAALGMRGPEAPFAGRSMLAEAGLPPLGGRGAAFHTDRTSIKFFPAQFNSQAAIFAALELREALAGEPVEHLAVSTYRHAYVSTAGSEKWDLVNRETADHSMPYVVAAAFLDGELGVAQFTRERMDDPALRDLMGRITVREDPEMTKLFPDAQATTIEATTADGVKRRAEVVHPRGHYRNPMTDEDISRKFRAAARAHMTEDACEAALAALWAFDSASSAAEAMESLRV